MARCLASLRLELPLAQETLKDVVRKDGARLRTVVLQLLIEDEAVVLEAEFLRQALRDPSPAVRRVALRGVKKRAAVFVEEEASAILLDYCSTESVARNRLAAVAILVGAWGSKDLVPSLVEMLEKEGDEAVKRKIFRALRALSGRPLGDDLVAWKEHVEWLRGQEESRILLEQLKVLKEANSESREP
jgi:hypothetical protein